MGLATIDPRSHEVQRYSHLKMSKLTKKCMAIRMLSDTASGWRYISLLILTFLKLAWLTPNLGILWILLRFFWLCGSIVAYPIIYRLVPSPSRFEIRQLRPLSRLLSTFLERGLLSRTAAGNRASFWTLLIDMSPASKLALEYKRARRSRERENSSPDAFSPDCCVLRRSCAWLKGEPAPMLMDMKLFKSDD